MTLSTHEMLTDDHYKAIGKVAVEWSYVELDIETIIWHMIDMVDDDRMKTALALTTHLGSETRLDILKTLIHNKVGSCPEYDEFNKFIENDFKTLRAARNEIIHGVYYHADKHPEKASFIKVKAKGKLIFNSVHRATEALEQIAQDIANLRGRLDKLPVWRFALPQKFVGPNR